MIETIKQHFNEAKLVLEEFSNNLANFEKIKLAGDILATSLQNGCKIYSAGNGGSMCDAIHFAEELSGRYRNNRKALAAISISDSGHITCVGNDYGFDFIFSRFLEACGNEGDVFVAISTSGNSKNIIEACKVALEKKIKIIALTGKDGGELKKYANVEIRAPFSSYADRAQEIHIKVIHALIDYVERKLNIHVS